MLTASGTNRAPFCLWWARPDAVSTHYEAGHGATVGTEVHAAIEATLMGEPLPVLSAEASVLYDVWLERRDAEFHENKFGVEWAYAMNLDTGECELLGRIEHRQYPQREGFVVFGTVDAVALHANPVCVIDWKTAFDELPIQESEQLKTLGLMVARAHGLTDVRVSMGKIRPEGLRFESLTMNSAMLDAHEARLFEWLDSVEHAEAKAGPWCRKLHCSQFGVCPATRDAATQLGAIDDGKRHLAVYSPGEITGPEHARNVYDLWRQAKAQVDRVGEALRAWSFLHGAIATGSGKQWGPHATKREFVTLRSREHVQTVAAVLGEHIDKAITFDTTKTALRAAAKAAAKERGVSITSIEKQLFEALAQCGAIETKESVTYDER